MPQANPLYHLILFLIIFFPLFYCLLALVLYTTATTDVNIDISPCAENVLPDGATSAWFDKAAEPLLKEGFVDRGYWMMSMANNVQTLGIIIRWLYHPESSTSASLTRLKARLLLVESVTMGTGDTLGRTVWTTNNRLPKLHSAHPHLVNWRLVWMKDPATLFRAHQVFCKESGFGPWRKEVERERFPTELREGTIQLMEQQVELGLYRKKNSTTFTPTEWGALVMAMRSMPGVKQWRAWRESQKAKEILRAAGVQW